jgi:uncharacterized integral membrane protein
MPPLAKSNTSPAEDDAREHRIQAAFCDYLERIGQPDEAEFVRAEAAASRSIKNLMQSSSERDFIQILRPVAGAWIVGGALLCSLLVVLLVGAVSVALQQSRYLTQKTAFPVILILSVAAVGGTMAFLGTGIIGPWNQWLSLFDGMAAYSESANDSVISDWALFRLFLPQVAGVFVLCLPVVALVILANQSRRIPLSRASAFVRTCAGSALPVATVLLFLYSAVVIGSLCLEARLRQDADRLAAGECSFIAEIMNQPLPGFSQGHVVAASQDRETIR